MRTFLRYERISALLFEKSRKCSGWETIVGLVLNPDTWTKIVFELDNFLLSVKDDNYKGKPPRFLGAEIFLDETVEEGKEEVFFDKKLFENRKKNPKFVNQYQAEFQQGIYGFRENK